MKKKKKKKKRELSDSTVLNIWSAIRVSGADYLEMKINWNGLLNVA